MEKITQAWLDEHDLRLCYRCERVKPISEFYKNSRKRDGLNICCKICVLAKKHGITPEQYDEMRDAQNGLCAACGYPDKLVLDHDDTTGFIRGFVCGLCNPSMHKGRGYDPETHYRRGRYLEEARRRDPGYAKLRRIK